MLHIAVVVFLGPLLNNCLYFIFSGVKILEGVSLEQVNTEGGRVSSVATREGTIKCEYFVNCAGLVSVISLDYRLAILVFYSVLDICYV